MARFTRSSTITKTAAAVAGTAESGGGDSILATQGPNGTNKFGAISEAKDDYSFTGWNEQGPISRRIISSFLNQYGPTGNGKLPDTELTTLTAIALRLAGGKELPVGNYDGDKAREIIKRIVSEGATDQSFAKSSVATDWSGWGNAGNSADRHLAFDSTSMYGWSAKPVDGDDGISVANETATGGLNEEIERDLTSTGKGPPNEVNNFTTTSEGGGETVVAANPQAIRSADRSSNRSMRRRFRSSVLYQTAFQEFVATEGSHSA